MIRRPRNLSASMTSPGAVAIASSMLGAGQAGGGGASFSFPIAPLVDLDSGEMAAVSNRYMPNKVAAAPLSTSVLPFGTGYIQGAVSSLTATQNYANGPNATLSALRIQITGGGQAWIFCPTIVIATAHTLEFKAKSNTGAGAQTFRYGPYGGTLNTANVDESGWTTCSISMASGTVTNLCVRDNTVAADILIDEVQFVPGTAGTFSATPGHGCPELAQTNGFTRTNGAVDTSAGAKKALITLPSYPATTSFTEGTLAAVFSTTDAATSAAKVIGREGSVGAVEVGSDVGNAFGGPIAVYGGGNSNAALEIVNRGFHCVISTWKAGSQQLYFDGVLIYSGTNTLATWSRRIMALFGDPPPSSWAGFPFKGLTTKVFMAGTWHTEAQAKSLYQKLKYDHDAIVTAAGAPSSVLPAINLAITEGDSITFTTISYVYKYMEAQTTQRFAANVAVSGSTLQTGGMSRKAAILSRVQTAVALGHNPIVSVFHGANGVYSMAQAHAFSDDLRSAGAKILYCTGIHQVGNPGFNATIDTMNTDLIAEGSALYDALARFDGVLTETVGVDYGDVIHPNTAGHTKLQTAWTTAVDTLMV